MTAREATKIIDYLRTHAEDHSTSLSIVLNTHRNYLIKTLMEYQGGELAAAKAEKGTTSS